eukprot:1163759-Amorphochlora_amoeboformis.AAC.1
MDSIDRCDRVFSIPGHVRSCERRLVLPGATDTTRYYPVLPARHLRAISGISSDLQLSGVYVPSLEYA